MGNQICSCKRCIPVGFQTHNTSGICLPEHKGWRKTDQSSNMGHCRPREVRNSLFLLFLFSLPMDDSLFSLQLVIAFNFLILFGSVNYNKITVLLYRVCFYRFFFLCCNSSAFFYQSHNLVIQLNFVLKIFAVE